MRDHIKDYMAHLEEEIGRYMERPVSERSAEAIDGMTECWMHLDKAQKKMAAGYAGGDFTKEDADRWAEKMVNSDGTMGAHWTMDQTTGVAESTGVKFQHITDWCWWIVLNMMYSDYGATAERFGVDTPEFFAALAKDFLFDKDGPGPREKLAAYYHAIICDHNDSEE